MSLKLFQAKKQFTFSIVKVPIRFFPHCHFTIFTRQEGFFTRAPPLHVSVWIFLLFPRPSARILGMGSRPRWRIHSIRTQLREDSSLLIYISIYEPLVNGFFVELFIFTSSSKPTISFKTLVHKYSCL